ncbi:MAG: hypothetical protein FVQ82_01290 [Planctomycetes bacterium]|nr:hypothetical protein [Planctomycetota bacterium]
MIKNIILLLALALLPISGCLFETKKDDSINPLRFYRYPDYNLKSIGRVVMLEMENLSANQELGKELTMALSEEIQKKQIFGLDTLYIKDPKWKSLNLSTDSDISMKQLGDIQTRFGAAAVLYGEIVRYRPFPRYSIGLKLELVDCTTGQLLWAIDQVWDSTDAKTEERIKSFFSTQMRSGYKPMEWEIVMYSPRIYNKFITYEISQTLE